MPRRPRRKKNPNEPVIVLILLGIVVVALKASSINDSMSRGLVIIIALVTALITSSVMGFFLFRSFKVNSQNNALAALSMSDVDNLSGLEFEDYVSGLLSAQGYVVRLTPINDFGVDVIALRDNIRTAVQTKRYSKPVGLRAVQEVCGGMVQHHCTRTMVVTSNYFTPKAKQLAKTNGCRLVDRDELARWVSSYS